MVRLAASLGFVVLLLLGSPFFSATAAAQTRCIAFYAVPHPPIGQWLDVDPCWEGAHITVAGFHAYPVETSDVNALTAEEALNVTTTLQKRNPGLSDEPLPSCQATSSSPYGLYHMNDTANTDMQPEDAKTEPSTDDLKILLRKPGTTDKSKTFIQLLKDLDTLKVMGTSTHPVDYHKLQHVTIDQCSCYDNQTTGDNCPTTYWAEWGKKPDHGKPESRPNWYLIPVEYVGALDCSEPKVTTPDLCQARPGYPDGDRKMHCTAVVSSMVWYYDRGMPIYCAPEPGLIPGTLASLLTLFALHVRRRHGAKAQSPDRNRTGFA